MSEIRLVESVLCSTALAFIVMCVCPDYVTSKHLAYSDGSRCLPHSLYSPVCSYCKNNNISFAIMARLSSERPDNLLFIRAKRSLNYGSVSHPASLFSVYWWTSSLTLVRMEQRHLAL